MNSLADFPPGQFQILGVCDSCGHTAWIDREKMEPDKSINALKETITCQACGSRECGIRIVYVGSMDTGDWCKEAADRTGRVIRSYTSYK